MSALDNTIAILEHDLEMSKLGRVVDVARIERSLERLRKERAQEFAQWLESIPKEIATPIIVDPNCPRWELTPMGMDETQRECEERRNRCSPIK